MFTKVKSLVRSHWKKVVIGGVVVQGLIVGAKYAAGRLLEYHEVQALDVFTKMKKERHFESMDSTFKASFVALSISLRETLLQCLDADPLTEQLKAGIGGNIKIETKLGIWETLKVIGFTRVLVIIYGTSLLSLLLRIQLGVIGGYLFLESNEPEPKHHEWRNVNGIILSNNTAMDNELQQKYLALATHLVKFGVRKLCDSIYSRASAVVGSVGLKQRITISELEKMFLCIAAGVNRDMTSDSSSNTLNPPAPSLSTVKYPWKYVFPADVLESRDNFRNLDHKCRPHYEPPDMYERLLSETFDLLDSDDVIGLLSTFERQGISHFCDRVGDYVKTDSKSNGTAIPARESDSATTSTAEPTTMFTEVPIPMSKIIPMLNNLVAEGGISESDPWLSVLFNSEASRTLGANVYESFSNTSLD